MKLLAHRRKGFSKSGGQKVATLSVLINAAPAIDLSSGAVCWWPSCSWLVAVECLPAGASKCTADSKGNIGRSNVGQRNFGVGNHGDANIGNGNQGSNNWGDKNAGFSNVGFGRSGVGRKLTARTLAQNTDVILRVTPKPDPRAPPRSPPSPSPTKRPPPRRPTPPPQPACRSPFVGRPAVKTLRYQRRPLAAPPACRGFSAQP